MVIKTDLCVIGAGSAGLSVAAGAVQMGASVVLIEAAKMGGDCLNTGCVPSKALLAAAEIAQTARRAGGFGIVVPPPQVDFAAVHRHVHDVIGAIAPHDSVERFEGLGCQVIQARARFVDDRTVEAGDALIKARRFVIATGSRAAAPPIAGLDQVPFLTNETLFELTALPAHLVIIGGGPIGCEMAQAFRRLGSRVTVIDQGPILPRDDADAVAVVRAALLGDGVALLERTAIARVAREGAGVAVHLADGRVIAGSHLLIAAGRRPNIEGLGLESAGITATRTGITVDRRLRTTNTRVYAAGDVTGGPQFTHWAGYHAGIIIRNALFRLPASVDDRALPWVTYTDPELAQAGMTEAAARTRHGAGVRVVTAPFADNDRARSARATEGFAKIITDRRGRVLGATIVGARAGELIQIWGVAIQSRLRIGAVAGMVAPYPTLGEINKRAAGAWFTPALFSRRTRWLVRFLSWFG